MKGLSGNIEDAVKTVIAGLEYDMDIDIIDDNKMKSAMKSKIDSFMWAKQLLDKWTNSQNRPSDNKLINYVEQLIDAGDSAMNVLQKALSAPIDYDELEQDKHGTAIGAKNTILAAIFELDAGLMELKLQIESNNINLSGKEFTIGYPEKFANGEFYPKENYYKNWYDEESDAINICPNGTVGKKITLDGLNIILPKKPKKEDILFHDLPKKEQYWKRTELPKGLTSTSVEAWSDYILNEFRLRREGVWFMNNGEAVYLTGNAYFALQWCKMRDDGGYMDFRYAQLDMFYFAEACMIDSRSLGQLFVKSRRTGFTYIILFIMLNLATSTNNGFFGLTSKSDTDAKKAFIKLSYAFLNLPFFFRPIVKGGEDSHKMLEFAKPSDRSKLAKKSKNTETDGYLNTIIDYQPTNDGSYDGQKMTAYLGDECIFEDNKILTIKGLQKIKYINVGDRVLCADGIYREVMNKTIGNAPLFRIKQKRGKDYLVNGQHKLYLKKNYGARNKKQKHIFITPEQYMELAPKTKDKLRRVCFKGFNNRKDKYTFIDPYIFGVWLGDGFSKASNFVINNEDVEIRKTLDEYSKNNNFKLKEINNNMDSCYQIYMSDPTIIKNRFINQLMDWGVWGNKRIPTEVFNFSKKQMLEVLSGIIDTDGSRYKNSNVYSIEMSRENLIKDIYNLSKMCGIVTSEITKRERIRKETKTISYNLIISDTNSEIPVKCERKKQSHKSTCTHSNKMEVIPEGNGTFIGLTLNTEIDEEALMVLEDYTLTKNCSKWKKPANYLNHWGRISPTFDEGGMIVGKAHIGSTVNPMKDGGEAFKILYSASKIDKRDNITKRTPSGLYSYFLGAHDNMTKFTDKYGICHTTKPKRKTYNVAGQLIDKGSIDFLEARRESKKKESEVSYNEELRAFPMTVEEAFRDSSDKALFNLTKIYEQIDFNDSLFLGKDIIRGNFVWKNGVADTEVEWRPDRQGRFYVTWIPSEELRNNYKVRRGIKYPMNEHIGAFGCDSYDISGAVGGGGSKGALHGMTKNHMENAPTKMFFLEYIARPQKAEIFYEDVLKAIVFYGMPILIENNKPRLLYHLKNRGYRGFSMNRPDRYFNQLSKSEKELGGIPSAGAQGIQDHAGAIESYIIDYVGNGDADSVVEEGNIGNMYFTRTLADWANFDINNRTDYDASISSGYSIMANQKTMYLPEVIKQKLTINIAKFNNKGNISEII